MRSLLLALGLPPVAAGVATGLATGCAGFPDAPPQTNVVLDNEYAPDTSLVVYDAHWLNVSFAGQAVPPGASSAPMSTVPASADNTAYVVLAAGWDRSTAMPPETLVVLQSRSGFAVALGDTLHIPVDDETFEGNCAAGSRLTQDQANFLTQIVFAADFAGLAYDPAGCTTSQIGDEGAP
jgi:hypothetical protein